MNRPLTLRGQCALILHPEDQSRRNLVTALNNLNIESCVNWPEIDLDVPPHHVMFFDVDRGHDGQFNWKKGEAPCPLIAMIGSEAPGRIEWAMSHKASAYLLKPVQSAGVFSALTIAFNQYEQQREQAEQVDDLMMRLKARPLVLKAVLDEMLFNNIDDDAAFKIIRTKSMQRQLSVEEYCVQRLDLTQKRSMRPRTRENG